jgi:hypothetical protein
MSAQSTPLLAVAVIATGAIAASRFVTPAAAQAAADANTLGVARFPVALGERLSVDVIGTTVVESGGAVSFGATLKSDASGRAVPWASSGAKVALSLDTATAAGQLIEVLLIPNVA